MVTLFIITECMIKGPIIDVGYGEGWGQTVLVAGFGAHHFFQPFKNAFLSKN